MGLNEKMEGVPKNAELIHSFSSILPLLFTDLYVIVFQRWKTIRVAELAKLGNNCCAFHV